MRGALIYYFLRGARKERLPLVVYRGLVEQLFGTYGSFAAGVVCGLIGCLVPYVRTGKPEFLACMVATVAISAVRTWVMVAYRSKDRSRAKIREVVFWEAAYGVFGSWIFMGVLGITAALCVVDTDDMVSILYASLIVVGSAGAMAGRNAGRRRIVTGQVLASCLPLSFALLWTREWALAGIAFMIFMHFVSMMSYSKSLYRSLRDALVGSEENKRLAKTLKDQNVVVDSALNNMSHGLCMFGGDRRVAFTNHRFDGLFGHVATSLGSNSTQVFNAISSYLAPADGDRFVADCEAAMLDEAEKTVAVRDLKGRHFEFRFKSDNRGGYVVVVDDVTKRMQDAERIEHMAHFDLLTGLPNRFQFRDRLAAYYAAKDDRFGLFVVDLDLFKEVNDTLGHPMGDALLKQVADRLRLVARKGDLVSRFGGDEFAVLIAPDGNLPNVESIANRFIEAVGAPYFIDGHKIVIGASIGIALATEDGADADTLIKNGDMALYHAKAMGRGTWKRFTAELNDKAREKRELESDLRSAIVNNELVLHYQPIVDARDRTVVAAEALIRWEHPVRGMVSPLDFIGLAEETGIIVEIGDWVVAQACRDAMTWPEHVRVAVNFSPVQFRRGDVLGSITKALVGSGLPARRLEVEITEGLLMQDNDASDNVVRRISRMGCRLALDDFGTGFSGLSYLKRFPYDKLKIDRTFIRDIVTDEGSTAIVNAMAHMTMNMGKSMVCEGVETQEQLDVLMRNGVTQIQGYFFSPPRPNAEVIPMMRNGFGRRLRAVA